MEPITVNVQPLSLANIGDGTPEQHFAAFQRDLLRVVAEHHDALDHGGTRATKDGCMSGKFVLSVEFHYNVEAAVWAVATTVKESLPDRKTSQHLLTELPEEEPLLVAGKRHPKAPKSDHATLPPEK